MSLSLYIYVCYIIVLPTGQNMAYHIECDQGGHIKSHIVDYST